MKKHTTKLSYTLSTLAVLGLVAFTSNQGFSWLTLGLSILGIFSLDFIFWVMHRVWHSHRHKFHFEHHKMSKFYHLHWIEHASYAAATLLVAIILGFSTQVFLSLFTFVLMFNAIGHTNFAGSWHLKHHSNSNVNYSFIGVADFLFGTNSSKSLTKATPNILMSLFIALLINLCL